MIVTRPVVARDAQAMCDLLNPIILDGRTTAHRHVFDAAQMIETHINEPLLIQTTGAFEDKNLLGFQLLKWPEPKDSLPETWGVIASFVRSGQQGKGIGQMLWQTTLDIARSNGVHTIDATIRTDNIAGLTYYAGLGFTDYNRIDNAVLSDGSTVSKIRKKLEL